MIDLRVQAPHFSPPLSGDVGEYLGNTKDKIDQIMIMSRVILLISAFALAGCWQSEDRIYMAEDYFIPVKSELVSISDEFGPLGIYEINSENQYRPVFRDAEPNSFEQKFRVFNIGLVPIDRMATYKEPHEDWQANRNFSKSVFEDGDTTMFVSVAEQEGQAGQLLFASFVSNDVFGICSTLLQQGKGLHDEFSQFASMRASGHAFTRKAGIAMLVLAEATEAKGHSELECDEYKIKAHAKDERAQLFEAARAGDVLRTARTEELAAEARNEAVELAEARAARQASQNDAAPKETNVSTAEQYAVLQQELSDLHREAYDINALIDRERWGTLEGVSGKYFGVDRRFRDRGLLFKSKMLCHNLSGYQSIYVTITHAASPGTNAAWVMRNNHVPIRIETERGTITHHAALEVIDNTRYTNTLRIIFADMIPSKLDNKYIQDPALLERTRRQAELFGTSVEALTRMGISFLSLEDAMHSKTIKIYADIRQNGAVRTVMLGDFGSEASEKGLGGFHAACLFSQ